MTEPLLSVIMPVYNAERYVKQAIFSILDQSYKNLEFIIIDDGSTDKSLQVIESIRDDRIKLVKSGTNKGQIYTRNLGLQLAEGDYISQFDADDIAYPDKFKKQISFLERNKEIGMLGAWVKFIDKNGNRMKGGWKLKAKPEIIPSIMLFKNYFLQSTVVYRKDCIKMFSYREGFEVAEDYMIWLEIIEQFKCWNLQEYLVDYRIHSESVMNTLPLRRLEMERKLFRWQFDKLGIDITDNEMELHLLIKNDEPIKSIDTLKQIESWLLKIDDKNREVLIYDPKILSRVLFNRWLKVCLKASSIHFIMMYAFLTSKIGVQLLRSYL